MEETFKGTVSRDGFGFLGHAWSVLGFNMGCGQFCKFFRCLIDFMAVNASLCWLNNVSGVYLIQVSLLLIGQQGLGHVFRYRPCFQLAGGLCKFYASTAGK